MSLVPLSLNSSLLIFSNLAHVKSFRNVSLSKLHLCCNMLCDAEVLNVYISIVCSIKLFSIYSTLLLIQPRIHCPHLGYNGG